MKVFVAGATGVVGTQTVALLLAAGHQVTGLARSAQKADLLARQGARAVQASLFDPDALARAAAGHDAVVNLATHIPAGAAAVRARAWREDDRIRTEGSRVLVDAALQHRVARLVQEAVTFVYPDRGDEWITEETGPEPNRRSQAATMAARFYPALLQKLAGPRAEPLTRSQRVDSAKFAAAAGWAPVGRGTQGGWSGHPVKAEA